MEEEARETKEQMEVLRQERDTAVAAREAATASLKDLHDKVRPCSGTIKLSMVFSTHNGSQRQARYVKQSIRVHESCTTRLLPAVQQEASFCVVDLFTLHVRFACQNPALPKRCTAALSLPTPPRLKCSFLAIGFPQISELEAARSQQADEIQRLSSEAEAAAEKAKASLAAAEEAKLQLADAETRISATKRAVEAAISAQKEAKAAEEAARAAERHAWAERDEERSKAERAVAEAERKVAALQKALETLKAAQAAAAARAAAAAAAAAAATAAAATGAEGEGGTVRGSGSSNGAGTPAEGEESPSLAPGADAAATGGGEGEVGAGGAGAGADMAPVPGADGAIASTGAHEPDSVSADVAAAVAAATAAIEAVTLGNGDGMSSAPETGGTKSGPSAGAGVREGDEGEAESVRRVREASSVEVEEVAVQLLADSLPRIAPNVLINHREVNCSPRGCY